MYFAAGEDGSATNVGMGVWISLLLALGGACWLVSMGFVYANRYAAPRRALVEKTAKQLRRKLEASERASEVTDERAELICMSRRWQVSHLTMASVPSFAALGIVVIAAITSDRPSGDAPSAGYQIAMVLLTILIIAIVAGLRKFSAYRHPDLEIVRMCDFAIDALSLSQPTRTVRDRAIRQTRMALQRSVPPEAARRTKVPSLARSRALDSAFGELAVRLPTVQLRSIAPWPVDDYAVSVVARSRDFSQRLGEHLLELRRNPHNANAQGEAVDTIVQILDAVLGQGRVGDHPPSHDDELAATVLRRREYRIARRLRAAVYASLVLIPVVTLAVLTEVGAHLPQFVTVPINIAGVVLPLVALAVKVWKQASQEDTAFAQTVTDLAKEAVSASGANSKAA